MSDKEPWHLRKELSIGTIVSLLTLGAGSVIAFTKVQSDLENKASKTDVAVILDRQARFSKDIDEIKGDLKAILEAVRDK